MSLAELFWGVARTHGEVFFNLCGNKSAAPQDVPGWPPLTEDFSREFHATMTKGLPAETDLTVTLYPDGRISDICYVYEDETSSKKFSIGRFIEHDHGHTSASGTSTMSPDLQGHGVTKAVDTLIYPLIYVPQGVETVQIATNKINTYAAARRGFVPDDCDTAWGRIRRIIDAKLDFVESRMAPYFGPLPAKAADAIREGTAMASPKGMWKVVDERTLYGGIPLGKLLTLDLDYLPLDIQEATHQLYSKHKTNPFNQDCSWRGHLDLSGRDPEFLARISAYTGVEIVSARHRANNNSPESAKPRIK